MRSELPMPALLDNKAAGGILLLLGFIDGKKDKAALAFDLRRCARNEVEGDAVEVERDFVAGDAFLFGDGIAADEGLVALKPGEIRRTNKNAAKLGFRMQVAHQAEAGALVALLKQDEPGIDAVEVLSVPFAVIVALADKEFLVP